MTDPTVQIGLDTPDKVAIAGDCACGCGEPTRLAPRTDSAKGWTKGVPLKFIYRHRLPLTPVDPPLLDGEWRPVVGQEGTHLVSSDGRIYSLLVDRELKPTAKDSGHWVVTLGGRLRRVHHIVLEAFEGSCPSGEEGCHWDDDPSNNSISNLSWGTRSKNVLDQVRNGRHNNATKNRCPQGHEYTEENTYRHRDGRRECRTCKKARR